ncbi:energy-coupling factor transporter transmembrane component T family protein [Leucobacter denitrificans]|uniref:Energy-coupling factor transporter transmembrane protein EcfT n=1 Tax=Leucobacter denitrificans TaxID=683042 RepID=A0A7G9S2I1_9MICO|nr:energy-coupling factor transporter transmembrane protein EcfT [Leucobacter denitrificans]QNN62056.1 energy-coupling factor transporter transmembrane protein EcfT [Leucobacter denitrificans]
MITSPLGAYITRQGPLHRLRPGLKLLGLFVLAIAVIATGGWIWTTAALCFSIALALVAGLRGRDFWRVARGFSLIAIPLFAFQAWSAGWLRGYEVVGDLFALILAASAVTASTKATEMLDTIECALRPFQRFGVNTERVALTFSLAIRMIPGIQELARETLDAARARGLERSPRARSIPLVLRTVSQAHLTGEALAARGIGD